MKSLDTNSNIALTMLLEAAKTLGLPVEQLVALLPESALNQADEANRYQHDKVPLLWQWLLTASGDEEIGIKLAQQCSLTSQTMLTFLFMSCETLGQGIDKIIQYQTLIGDHVAFSLDKTGDRSHLSIKLNRDGSDPIRAQNDFVLLLIHNWLKMLLPEQWQLQELHLSHPKPQCTHCYRDNFDTPLMFSALDNSLIFDSKLLQISMPFANSRVNHLHSEQAEQVLDEAKIQGLIEQIKTLIHGNLQNPSLAMAWIAKKVGIPERQLKSLLQHQGTHFSELLEQSRQQKACKLLSFSDLSMAEISDACGFSEPSVFNRAFKRWKNMSPTEYQRDVIKPYKNAN